MLLKRSETKKTTKPALADWWSNRLQTKCLLSLAVRCIDFSTNAAEPNGGDYVMLTVPKRASWVESSKKACAIALFPCTCCTESHLPSYSVLLNARRPLRPIATFSVIVVTRKWLSLRGTFFLPYGCLQLASCVRERGNDDHGIVASSLLVNSPELATTVRKVGVGNLRIAPNWIINAEITHNPPVS